MKIEFALLYSDHTWDTKIVDVPFDEDTLLTDIDEWAQMQFQYDRDRSTHVVFNKAATRVYIYSDEPEEEP